MFNLLDKLYNDKLREKDKAQLNKFAVNNIYRHQLLNSIIGMIEYDNVPDGLEMKFVELYKILHGICGITKDSRGNFTAYIGAHSNQVNNYGLGTHFVGADAVESYDFEINKNGVVAWNNKLGISDIEHINMISDSLTELKTSLDYNIMYARYNPLISVKDAKTKTALDTALKNTRDGVPTTFLSNLSMALDEFGVKDIELINICDVKNSDKLQYLYKAFDDTFRHFYNVYGISLSTTSKMAQQNDSEINQTNALAMLYPLERLKCANTMCEELNQIYGTNISAHFSEVWQVEYDKYKKSMQAVCDDSHVKESSIDIENVEGGMDNEQSDNN